MRKKGLLVFLSLVLVLSLVIAGCAQPAPEEEVAPPPEEEVAPPPEEEVPSEPKVFKFGLPINLTGIMALWGLAEKRGFEFGAEIINAEGGIKVGDQTYRLEFAIEDAGSDPTKAVDAVRKLVFEEEVAVVYSGDDNALRAFQPFLEENRVIQLNGTTAPCTSPDFPHTFHTACSNVAEGIYGTYSYMLEQHPDVKTVFIVNSDEAMGHAVGAMSEALTDYFGLELVAPPEYFDMGMIDFAPLAAKIVSLKPDVLDLGSTWDAFTGMILEGVKEQGGFKGKVIINAWGGNLVVLAGFDPELVEGIISWSHDYTSELYPPRMREVAQEYIDKYGGMDAWAISFADQTFIIKSAIEQAGSIDKDKIYEFLSSPGAEVDSLFGRLGFFGSEHWMFKNIDRQLKIPVPTAVTRDGVDYVVRLTPYEEYSKIFAFMTAERFPELVELIK